jgi:superfamily II DNA or RNA helicase
MHEAGSMNSRRTVSSWADFCSSLAPLGTKAKGDAFERLVKLYLTIDPQYSTQLRRVWLHKDVPPKLRTHLNLPDEDQGIDLIAETRDGEYWAIQAKYRSDTQTSITWSELSTFAGLAYAVCRHIKFALVCTTTENVTDVLQGLPGVGFRTSEVWQGLGGGFFRRLRKEEPRKLAPTPVSPRPHQERAISRAVEHYEARQQRRGKLIMPCGTGKSLTAYWIAEQLQAETILIAVPSLALVRQTLGVWLTQEATKRKPAAWLCVCSDESAGKPEQDEAVAYTHELGVPCITNPKEIASWLKKHRDGRRIIFTTYQSGESVAAAARATRTTFDLGLMDEAHKTTGRTDKVFSHLLWDENVKVERRLFMTATERRYRGESDEIVSMEDAEVYGETFDLLSFKEALDADPPILCDYEVLTLVVRHSEVAKLIATRAFVQPDKGDWRDIDAETLASVVALRRAMLRYPIHHAISFHKSIKRAQQFKEHQDVLGEADPSSGTLETFHVSARVPTSERARVLDQFIRSKRSLVTNARCLTEGVDVPGIDCVMFADPRQSTVDIVQATGRALRTARGKKKGYVIVPLLVDDGASPEEVAESSAFKSVVAVLRALGSNDERIIEYFKSIAGRARPQGDLIHFEFTEQVAEPIDITDFAQAIELKCWGRLVRLVGEYRPFEDARAFVRTLGLKTQAEWGAYCRRRLPGTTPSKPDDIPSTPDKVYAARGWKGMGDWLGTGAIAPQDRSYRPFVDARAFVHSLRLRTQAEWGAYYRGQRPDKPPKPEDIPATPERVYADQGWKGMGDWLGTGVIARQDRRYRTFKKARAFVRSLGLRSQSDWGAYCRGRVHNQSPKPDDIPAAPSLVYADKGWKGMGDWLGTGNIAPRDRQYRSFEAARDFVRSLGLRNQADWSAYCRGKRPDMPPKPEDIPATPSVTYAGEGWRNLGDWLGTGMVATRERTYRSFGDARAFARSLGLLGHDDWIAYCRGERPDKSPKPDDIPSNANNTYAKKGWNGWGDWLGTGRIANQNRRYRPFAEARTFAQSLGLQDGAEWRAYCQGQRPEKPPMPEDVPAKPSRVYAQHGWMGMGDWLGTGTLAPSDRRYRSFEDARSFVRSLGLRNQAEWGDYCRNELSGKPPKPADVPATPERVYAESGWRNLGDWLGTGTVSSRERTYRPFEEARAFVRTLQLRSNKAWRAYARGRLPDKPPRPIDIPAAPHRAYANQGWHSMGDWLGTGTVSSRERAYRPFEEARTFVRTLGLKTQADWAAYCRGERPDRPQKPEDVPANPVHVYRNKGWTSLGDWLGTGRVANRQRTFRPFEDARAFVRSLGLKSQAEWGSYCRGRRQDKPPKPPDIPAYPNETYSERGWQGMGDWLGTGRIADQDRQYRSFEEARAFARSLKLEYQAEWWAYCRGERPDMPRKPEDIPANPNQTYADKGWRGYGDWLGTGRVASRDRAFRSFEDARAFVRSLALRGQLDWRAYCRGGLPGKGPKPDDIPASPHTAYADKGWSGYGDWLGTGTVANRNKQFRPFEDARAFVRSLGLRSVSEWYAYCRGDLGDKPPRPADIPSNPNSTYAGQGWQGIRDWLGTARVRRARPR